MNGQEVSIRKIEREVVDQHHRSLNVWRRPQSAIVWGVLRCLGQVPRDFQSPDVPDVPVTDLWRVFNEFKRGAAQAIRWVGESEAVEYDWLPENEQILDDSMELLDWAVGYARLSTCFIAWTRKAMNAHVDTAMRRVSFTYNRNIGDSLLASDLKENERNCNALAPPVHAARQLLALDTEEDWLAAGQWPSERSKLIGHPAFSEIAEWTQQTLMPELDDGTSIGLLDLADLRRFWATMWMVSASYAVHEDNVDRRTNHRNKLPAAILCMTRDEWIRKVAVCVGVSQERAAALLDLFAFDPRTLHSSVTSHPFVTTSSGLILLCPRLVYHCDPRGLVSWILNAQPELRDIYGDLNHQVQHLWIKKLGDAFRAAGWSCWTEQRFRCGGSEITPDIVAWGRDRHVLVADFKHTTPPVEPRQSCDRLESFDGACTQMSKYRMMFRKHPEMLASVGLRDYDETPEIALVYRWPLAIPYGRDSQVAVLHIERLLLDLAEGTATVSQLLAMPAMASPAQVATREIRVAEWTFETPGVELRG